MVRTAFAITTILKWTIDGSGLQVSTPIYSTDQTHSIFWISLEILTGITMCKSACNISKKNCD